MAAGGRHSSVVAFTLLVPPTCVRFSFIPLRFWKQGKIIWDLATAQIVDEAKKDLLRGRTHPELINTSELPAYLCLHKQVVSRLIEISVLQCLILRLPKLRFFSFQTTSRTKVLDYEAVDFHSDRKLADD